MKYQKHTLYVSYRKGVFHVWGTGEDALEAKKSKDYRGNWIMHGSDLGDMVNLFSKTDITKITIEVEEDSKVL